MTSHLVGGKGGPPIYPASYDQMKPTHKAGDGFVYWTNGTRSLLEQDVFLSRLLPSPMLTRSPLHLTRLPLARAGLYA